jgi:hypothetical protein
MNEDNAAQRVRQHIKEWVEEKGYGAQRQLAKKIPGKFGEARNDQWISDIVNERANLRLKDLDPLADALGVAPGWLVRKRDRNYEELTMAESKLLRYFRALPDTVRHGFMTWLDYFFRIQDETAKRIEAERASKTSGARKRESPHARHRHLPRANG